YALINGIWTALGSTPVSGASGIAALSNASGGATLYVAANSNASTLRVIIDTAAFNTGMNISQSKIIYTATEGSQLMGLSLAPVRQPSSLMLAALAGVIAFAAYIHRGAMRKVQPAAVMH